MFARGTDSFQKFKRQLAMQMLFYSPYYGARGKGGYDGAQSHVVKRLVY